MAAGVYGLSGSGMDVDSLVKNMMKSSQIHMDTLKQRQTLLQWKKTEYNTMYSAMKDFQDNTIFPYKLQSQLMPKSVSADNTNVATVTANADAINFTHSLNVTSVAQGAGMTSSGSISVVSASAAANLAEQLGMGATTAVSLSFSDGTTTKTLSNNADGKYHIDGTTSIYSLVSDINKLGLNIRAAYDSTLDRVFLSSPQTGAANQITVASTDGTGTGAGSLMEKLKVGSGSILSTAGVISTAAVLDASSQPVKSNAQLKSLLGGTDTTLNLSISDGTTTKTLANYDTTGKTIDSFIKDINNLGINVRASYDAVSGRFSINPVGKNDKVQLSSTDTAGAGGNLLLSSLHLPAASSALPANFTAGRDAVFSLDGTTLTQSTNTFTISGVSYNLKSSGATNVTVTADIDKTVANVKTFIDSYNKMIATLNNEISQPKYKDYLPLTDDQRSAMKDTEVTAWEAKAKSGLLRNDTILQTSVQRMRSDLSSPISGVSGIYNSAASIGITTGAYTEGGKLYLDEAKLKKALQADPEIVNKIFASNASNTDADHATKGITARLYDTFTAMRSQLATQAGTAAQGNNDTQSNLAKQLKTYTTQIYDWKMHMSDLQSRYYKQFNAMESALSNLNKQSSWLNQQAK